jgi:hypothetical protein
MMHCLNQNLQNLRINRMHEFNNTHNSQIVDQTDILKIL